MLLAVKLSIVLGNTDNSLYGRLESWLLTMQLPTKLPKACSIDSMLEAMAYDKKKTGSSLRFIILKALGKAEITDAVNELQLREVLESSYE
jgi:3-dehydroquinate synthetase